MMKKNLKILFDNLCCSRCKSDFDENSIKFLKDENGLHTVNLVCQNCGKDFGLGFLNLSDNSENIPLKVTENQRVISYNDLLRD